jgi:hypothetical protein
MAHIIRRAADDDADLGLIARIVNEVSPEDSTSIDELRWAAATYPGGVRFLAEVDGRAVNLRLGYRPTPDLLTMRGPLFGGMMDRA